MEERNGTLENAYFRNVLNVIERFLFEIPRPAHVDEKPESKSITEYIFQEPIRTESYEKQQGRITITYSITETTQFTSMAGLVLEKEPIVFECYQGNGNNTFEVRGYYSTKDENAAWNKSLFDKVWQQLEDSFTK